MKEEKRGWSMEREVSDGKVEKTDCLQDLNLVNRCYEYDRMEHLSKGESRRRRRRSKGRRRSVIMHSRRWTLRRRRRRKLEEKT